MAGMAALQGAMASLSISAPGAASASTFWGNQLANFSAPLHGVCASRFHSISFTVKACPIVMRVSTIFCPNIPCFSFFLGANESHVCLISCLLICVLIFSIPLQLKRWERKKCKPNSLPVLHKMHVRIGDTVQVIAGREKGKVGEVTRLFKHNSTVIVKDLNLKSKHKKGTDDEPGEIVMIEGPIHSSNVMLYSKEKNVASRVGHKFLEDGTKVRYLIKTGEIIDSVEKWVKVFKEGDSE
ncbi:hypothetical protein PR202_gb28244 [Eleusine coracana subsp. coracana]|uniref:KOW domain-containing protein n=1 Tax=Eleusine coracana subsp. coracana TaxID=191504 RepID=A0AAV5FXC4_ELECO|nr:hypothetical protein PR202_gb28244 [Eleusine coracana subsp. coracana]